MSSLELKEKQEVLLKRCKEIIENCRKEVRDLTDDEAKELKDAKAEIRNLKSQLEDLNKRLADLDNDLDVEKRADDEKEDEEDDTENADSSEETADEDNNDADENQDSENSDDNTEEDNSDDEKEQKRNINNTKNMETQKFNLLKELRSAYETGKKINLNEVRAYTVTSEGEDVVQTDIYDIWGPLRAKNVLVEAGAQYITGIKNNVQIPLMGAVSVNFAGETDAAADGSGTFTNKTLSPKRITAKYPISLELLAQDSVGVEAKVREDIINAVNAKLEEVLLGSAEGTANQPAGLFYNASQSKIAAFSDITSLEAGIEANNIQGECKYIVSPSAKADLRAMAKSTKSTELVMQNGEIDGTSVLSTSHVKDKNIVYGDFSNLVIATWDNTSIDVVRDVASVGNGQVTIVVNAFVDAALVRENALAYATTSAE